MPVIKSAKKKLRQDKKRKIVNKRKEDLFKDAVKDARKNPSAQSVSSAQKFIDKAVKSGIIHKNKASRMKSSLAKLLATKSPTKSEPKSAAAAPKKKPAKKAAK